MSGSVGIARVATSLDSDLASLAASGWRSSDSPLAIARFVEECGADRPTSAMKVATDRLMAQYRVRHPLSAPIAVETLCELSSVGLTGKRPKRGISNVYSVDGYKPRIGHTGKIFFDGPKAIIKIPENLDLGTARVSVAHELGHLLIH